MRAKKTQSKSTTVTTIKKSAKVVKSPSRLTPAKAATSRSSPKIVKPAKISKVTNPVKLKDNTVKSKAVEVAQPRAKSVTKTVTTSKGPIKPSSLKLTTKIQTAEGWRRDRLKEFKRV